MSTVCSNCQVIVLHFAILGASLTLPATGKSLLDRMFPMIAVETGGSGPGPGDPGGLSMNCRPEFQGLYR